MTENEEPPEYPDVPNWRDMRTGRQAAWQEFADRHGITYPENSTRHRIRVAVQNWLKKRDQSNE